jgi:hypothetical protein
MNGILTRFGVSAGVVVVALSLSSVSAFAVPSDRQAWSSQKYGITVYQDELDPSLFWFVPLIRFESSGGKTALRPRTLANGKTEYSPRIIPYFSDDLRALVIQNIPAIKNDSQLKPVVATNIGVSLPDFAYKMTSESVTNYQYLGVPRLVRFQLDSDEAAQFDSFYQDDLGVTVEFTISYASVTMDKFYQIGVSCKDMERALDVGSKPGSGVSVSVGKVVLGADLEIAFKKAVQNNLNGVDIISKGDIPNMADTLRSTMELCFAPADPFGGGRTTIGGDNPGDVFDPRGGGPVDPGALLPRATAMAKFKFKKSDINTDKKAVVKNVSLKDSVSTTAILGSLTVTAASAVKIESTPLPGKTVKVLDTNSASSPVDSGIRVSAGDQWTIQADYSLTLRGIAVPTAASLPKMDGDLYYRIGNEEWQPVNRHVAIGSDVVRGGGELQFSIDLPSIRAKIPPKFRVDGALVMPVFTVQISGQRVGSK